MAIDPGSVGSQKRYWHLTAKLNTSGEHVLHHVAWGISLEFILQENTLGLEEGNQLISHHIWSFGFTFSYFSSLINNSRRLRELQVQSGGNSQKQIINVSCVFVNNGSIFMKYLSLSVLIKFLACFCSLPTSSWAKRINNTPEMAASTLGTFVSSFQSKVPHDPLPVLTEAA